VRFSSHLIPDENQHKTHIDPFLLGRLDFMAYLCHPKLLKTYKE